MDGWQRNQSPQNTHITAPQITHTPLYPHATIPPPLRAQLADEAVCIGEAASADSYLNIPSLLAAATSRGAQAIHPVSGQARRPMHRRPCRAGPTVYANCTVSCTTACTKGVHAMWVHGKYHPCMHSPPSAIPAETHFSTPLVATSCSTRPVLPGVYDVAAAPAAQGYGFLSENARFVEICTDMGLEFIGPKPSHIRTMGDKATARETMMAAGVPCVPGSDGLIESDEEAINLCKEIGFPVMIKVRASLEPCTGNLLPTMDSGWCKPCYHVGWHDTLLHRHTPIMLIHPEFERISLKG